MQPRSYIDPQEVNIQQLFNDVKGGLDRARNLFENGDYTDCHNILHAVGLEMWGLQALVGVTTRNFQGAKQQQKGGTKGQQPGKKRGSTSQQLFSIGQVTEALRKVA